MSSNSIGFVPQNGNSGPMFPVQGFLETGFTSPTLPSTAHSVLENNIQPLVLYQIIS